MNEVEFLMVGELLLDVINFEVAVSRHPIIVRSASIIQLTLKCYRRVTNQSGWIGATSTPRTSADGNWSAKSIAQIPFIILEPLHI